MNKVKFTFALQALFVVFIWSASKILMIMGLQVIPPYIFAAAIQTVAATGLILYYWLGRHHGKIVPTKAEIYLMILTGVVSFSGATIFSIVGLQYVSGATAGLIAATSSIIAGWMAFLVLKEKLRLWQFIGFGVALVGAYVFLSRDVLAGTLVGIGLLLVAEMGFAFNSVVDRLIFKRPEDISVLVTLVGNVIGAMVLVPIGLLTDGLPSQLFTWPISGLVVLIGLIFGFGGLLWSKVLDKLKVFEATILANTMIIQVAVLSVIFLHEALSWHNVTGGLLVMTGALLADRQLFAPLGQVRLRWG